MNTRQMKDSTPIQCPAACIRSFPADVSLHPTTTTQLTSGLSPRVPRTLPLFIIRRRGLCIQIHRIWHAMDLCRTPLPAHLMATCPRDSMDLRRLRLVESASAEARSPHENHLTVLGGHKFDIWNLSKSEASAIPITWFYQHGAAIEQHIFSP